MELKTKKLYERALEMSKGLDSAALGAERQRGAKRFKDQTLQEIRSFLQEFPPLADSGNFSEKDLNEMLGNTCLETASFLFSAGASHELWREWTDLAAELYFLHRDLPLSLELFVIGRNASSSDLAAKFTHEDLAEYRAQAILSIVNWQESHRKPPRTPVDDVDGKYQSLLDALERADARRMSEAVNEIVKFWLSETSYGTFEPGVFPPFEPSINAAVSALSRQGIQLELSQPKVRKFLEAGLG